MKITMVRVVLIAILLFSFFKVDAQVEKQKKAILEEGKLLYRSEMASWVGTDLLLGTYPAMQSQLGGYFSYPSGEETTRCVFFDRSDSPQVVARLTFGPDFDPEQAEVDTIRSPFSAVEEDYYQLRQKALQRMRSDTLFEYYENTSFNLIPVIRGKERKVYVLTGPQVSGIVVFGNDYLLTFNRRNQIKSVKKLHQNIIPIDTEITVEGDAEMMSTMHTHLETTGDFITPTDVCTLMLYCPYTNWKQHMVVSEKYIQIWNCETQTLAILPRDFFEKEKED
jgi:hypothetical protein